MAPLWTDVSIKQQLTNTQTLHWTDSREKTICSSQCVFACTRTWIHLCVPLLTDTAAECALQAAVSLISAEQSIHFIPSVVRSFQSVSIKINLVQVVFFSFVVILVICLTPWYKSLSWECHFWFAMETGQKKCHYKSILPFFILCDLRYFTFTL